MDDEVPSTFTPHWDEIERRQRLRLIWWCSVLLVAGVTFGLTWHTALYGPEPVKIPAGQLVQIMLNVFSMVVAICVSVWPIPVCIWRLAKWRDLAAVRQQEWLRRQTYPLQWPANAKALLRVLDCFWVQPEFVRGNPEHETVRFPELALMSRGDGSGVYEVDCGAKVRILGGSSHRDARDVGRKYCASAK